MIKVIALDLEGTLISNAVSQLERPGLCHFLEEVAANFPRVVIYTAVSESKFRTIAKLLVKEKSAPSWFADIEYINWDGKTKDLNNISGANPNEILLVDDYEPYVHSGQEMQWVAIKCFDHPYEDTDSEFGMVMSALRYIKSQAE